MKTLAIVLISAAVLVAGIMAAVRRLHPPEGETPSFWDSLAARARKLYRQWAGWRDRPRGDLPGAGWPAVAAPEPPPAPAPRPQRPAPARPAPARKPRPAGAGPSPAALARSGPAALMGNILSAPPPVEWQQLIARTASFEAEDAEAFLEFARGNAAGVYGFAEALSSFAEMCEVTIGLDPLVIQAAYALTEVQADTAEAWLTVIRQFFTAYQALLEAVENGLQIPHNARQFFGQGDAPAGQAA